MLTKETPPRVRARHPNKANGAASTCRGAAVEANQFYNPYGVLLRASTAHRVVNQALRQ